MGWVRERSATAIPALPAKSARSGWGTRAVIWSGILGLVLGAMSGWFLAFHLFAALLIPLMLGALAGILLMARAGKKRRR